MGDGQQAQTHFEPVPSYPDTNPAMARPISLAQVSTKNPLACLSRRPLSSSSSLFNARLVKAVTYSQNGDPADVLKWRTYPLGPPKDDELGLRFKLSPLNPADINTIQGRYPYKPKLRTDLVQNEAFYIAGNEGLAEVTELGPEIDPKEWQVGDWVVMGKPQLGTWQSHTNLSVQDVIKLPRSDRLTEVQAATMSVNMSTAYLMIKDYLPPSPPPSDQWIIQNGANSGVGQYVLQLCQASNIGCVGVIRDRPNLEALKAYLTKLGPVGKTIILTYEELADRSKTKSLNITLGFNCVGGNAETVGIMKCMANGSRLITYGGMSMKPLVVPTSLLLFRDLKLEGFMLSKWRMQASMKDHTKMIAELVELIDKGHLSEHEHTTVVDLGHDQDGAEVQEVLSENARGLSGKKFLFRFSSKESKL